MLKLYVFVIICCSACDIIKFEINHNFLIKDFQLSEIVSDVTVDL